MSNSYSISEGKLSRCDAEAVAPGPGEVAVEIQASSINYRDLGIQAGFYPSRQGVVPLSDGAGKVVAVGEGVSDLVPGQLVASCFYPFGRRGLPLRGITPQAWGARWMVSFAVMPLYPRPLYRDTGAPYCQSGSHFALCGGDRLGSADHARSPRPRRACIGAGNRRRGSFRGAICQSDGGQGYGYFKQR